MHVSGITSIYQLSSSTCNITVGEANSLSTSVPTTSHAVTPVTEGSKPNSHNLMPVGLNWSVCLHYLRDSVSANAHARCISACGQRITHCDLVKVSVQSCLWWHLLMWSFLDDGIILKFYQKSQKRKRDPCSTVIKPMVNSNRTMTIYWGISAAASLLRHLCMLRHLKCMVALHQHMTAICLTTQFRLPCFTQHTKLKATNYFDNDVGIEEASAAAWMMNYLCRPMWSSPCDRICYQWSELKTNSLSFVLWLSEGRHLIHRFSMILVPLVHFRTRSNFLFSNGGSPLNWAAQLHLSQSCRGTTQCWFVWAKAPIKPSYNECWHVNPWASSKHKYSIEHHCRQSFLGYK